jgi:hypothetical protein
MKHMVCYDHPAILQQYGTLLKAILDEVDPMDLIDILTIYRTNLGLWNKGSAEERESTQNNIRALGHKIHISVESLSYRARDAGRGSSGV